MNNKPSSLAAHTSTPKDFFLHLLVTATLFVSIISFISLLFQYINAAFPDQLNYYFTSISDSIRWSTSALIVVFPVYILISWLIGRDIAREPAKRDIRIRRWLIHFTLFVAAITIIIDLVTLIYNYLGGDLSIQFFLKTLTVLVVASAVFGYYIWDLRRTGDSHTPRLLAWVASITILGSIIGGFFIVGSPATQRARRFDNDRVSSLQGIQNQILNYWMQKNQLPTKLDDLKDAFSGYVAPTDPETNTAYEYRTLSALSFELCADFKIKNTDSQNALIKTTPTRAYYDDLFGNWDHDKGHVCFTRTIDPERYKNNVPPMMKL